jgi:hypothetical protein
MKCGIHEIFGDWMFSQKFLQKPTFSQNWYFVKSCQIREISHFRRNGRGIFISTLIFTWTMSKQIHFMKRSEEPLKNSKIIWGFVSSSLTSNHVKEELCPNKLSGACLPVQLIHENVTKIRIFIAVCVYFSICIILTCDVYLSDLQVLEIRTSDLQPALGRPSRRKPSQTSRVGSPQKHPKSCDQGECEAVYFGKEARMDLFEAVPTTS